GASAPQPDHAGLSLVPATPPPKRHSRAGWIVLALFVAATVLGYFWTTQTRSQKQVRIAVVNVPTATATIGTVQATIRATGTLAAQKSASLTAPRILGSRSGFNRGGDANFSAPPGGGRPGGGGGGDFNLTLLTLAKAGTRVHAGDVL